MHRLVRMCALPSRKTQAAPFPKAYDAIYAIGSWCTTLPPLAAPLSWECLVGWGRRSVHAKYQVRHDRDLCCYSSIESLSDLTKLSVVIVWKVRIQVLRNNCDYGAAILVLRHSCARTGHRHRSLPSGWVAYGGGAGGGQSHLYMKQLRRLAVVPVFKFPIKIRSRQLANQIDDSRTSGIVEGEYWSIYG